MSATWTSRDLDLVESLARRVRVMSFDQVRRIGWPNSCSLRTPRTRLRNLLAAGLLNRTLVNARLLHASQPLARWRPGKRPPNFAEISAEARGRWPQHAIPTEVFTATRLAANLFGSSAGRLPDVTHRDHDLLLAEVYVWYQANRPAEVAHWRGEDALPKAGFRIKDPDAFLIGPDQKSYRAIESAGSYSAHQLRSFHQHCREFELEYEIW